MQLNFPIEQGVSETEEYRTATRRGTLPASTTPPLLRQPAELRLQLHATPAGEIPVLCVHDREDFETLVRAIVMRNEPHPVPASQGAVMIANYNNHFNIFNS